MILKTGSLPNWINWTNGIAFLGLLPLLIDIVTKYRAYKKDEFLELKEIFDFDFFKSLIIGILILLFAIFQDRSDTSDKKELSKKVDTLIGQHKIDSSNNDSLSNTLRIKIDSSKNVIIDSMRTINDNTVKTILRLYSIQQWKLDSLSKTHGEKELNQEEKANIINRISKLTDNANPLSVIIGLYPYLGANVGKVQIELSAFLKSKGYQVVYGGAKMPISGTPIPEGLQINGYNKNEIHIIIGSFK